MTLKIELALDSRYHRTELFQLSNEKTKDPTDVFVWGVWTPITFPASDGDITYRVLQKDPGRLDLLAESFYGNPNLWWVIAHVNNIIDQFELVIGSLLLIPSKETVFTTLIGEDINRVPPSGI